MPREEQPFEVPAWLRRNTPAPARAPRRIQRKRTKGWRLPPNTVSVTRPGIFGNRYRVEEEMSPEMAVAKFRRTLEATRRKSLGWRAWAQRILDNLHRLKGQDVACYCREDAPFCHGDVLLELANAPEDRHG